MKRNKKFGLKQTPNQMNESTEDGTYSGLNHRKKRKKPKYGISLNNCFQTQQNFPFQTSFMMKNK